MPNSLTPKLSAISSALAALASEAHPELRPQIVDAVTKVDDCAGWTPPPTPPVEKMRTRSSHPYLFQTIRRAKTPARVAGGGDFDNDLYGPTNEYVDRYVGWPWRKKGGDYIDRDLVLHGSNPWFRVKADAVSGATAAAEYTADVTAALQLVQKEGRYCAFMVTDQITAPRIIAGYKSAQPPSIVGEYEDGEPFVLPCRITAANTTSGQMPSTMGENINLPVFMEFDRPTKPVRTAFMHFVVTAHWSGSNPFIDGYLLDPPLNTDPVQLGAAASCPFDEGLEKKLGIIGVHRYLKGAKLEDFSLAGPGITGMPNYNVGAEVEFDPALWGGPQNLDRLPHKAIDKVTGLSKWVNAGPAWSMVDDDYEGEGFEPLAPGLAALRVHMAADREVGTGLPLKDGSYAGYSGSKAADARIMLPEDLYGNVDRIFIRHYFRLGSGSAHAEAKERLHVFRAKNALGVLTDPTWTDLGGKFGITAEHVTSAGGVSGSAGAGAGWQMRMSWSSCDAEMGGPDEDGWSAGHHLYDFYTRQPKGHNYSGDSGRKTKFGQRGGLGGILYEGAWYCMENELKLNTVMLDAPGYVADGELRTWIDGALVYERTGMVFRSLPLLAEAPNPNNRLRPCRTLGVKGLWFNWFHGGKTLNTKDRTVFITGLAWGKEYIGPMAL